MRPRAHTHTEWEAYDTKVWTVSRLYCINLIDWEWVPVPDGAGWKGIASVLRSSGDEAKLLTVGAALAGGGGTNLVLMGHRTSPL